MHSKRIIFTVSCILVLVIGTGYAGWKHFFRMLSEDELQNYVPLAFDATGLKNCGLPESGIFDFFVYRPRYFVVVDESEWRNLNERLGYQYIDFKEDGFYKFTEFEHEILIGVLYPHTLSSKDMIKPLIADVVRKNDRIIFKLAITEKSYRGGGLPGEGFEPSYPLCAYQLIEVTQKT